MSETNPETTAPPTQTPSAASGATSLSGSASRSSRNRGGQSTRSGYTRSRGEQSILAINNADKDFKGKEETIGVLGLPIEKHLKFGLSFEDFQESMLQYSAAKLKRGNDMKPLIKFLKDPVKRLGEAPRATEEDKKDKELFEIWKSKSNKHNERIELMGENMEKLYGVMIGQCTDSLLSEIKGDDGYEDAEMDSNALWLLQTLKRISAGINTKKNEVQSYVNKLRDLIMLIQKPGESLDAFYSDSDRQCKH